MGRRRRGGRGPEGPPCSSRLEGECTVSDAIESSLSKKQKNIWSDNVRRTSQSPENHETTKLVRHRQAVKHTFAAVL